MGMSYMVRPQVPGRVEAPGRQEEEPRVLQGLRQLPPAPPPEEPSQLRPERQEGRCCLLSSSSAEAQATLVLGTAGSLLGPRVPPKEMQAVARGAGLGLR